MKYLVALWELIRTGNILLLPAIIEDEISAQRRHGWLRWTRRER